MFPIGSDFPLIDAVGKRHAPAAQKVRIVSLVPSITELLCALNLSDQLVGRTGFCIHPREIIRKIPKVGGTKNVKMEKIRELAPTHLIVNIDENPKPVVDELARFIPHVIVTHPLSPLDNPNLYQLLGGIFGRFNEAAHLCRRFEAVYADVVREAHSWPRQKVLYLVWKKPWMTVSRATYISRMLALANWDTVPEAAPARYPEIELTRDFLQDVAIVLLSSEPFRFLPKHADEVRQAFPAGVAPRIELIDGEMVSWYGSRAIEGLRYLSRYREALGVRNEA